MSAIATRLTTASKYTKSTLVGLATGVVGLIIQWIAVPSKFPAFPPGIVVLVVCGVLVAVGIRWWWTPIFAVLMAIWIIVGGIIGQELVDNLSSGQLGTITGNVVMCLGLVTAAISGILAMIAGHRQRR